MRVADNICTTVILAVGNVELILFLAILGSPSKNPCFLAVGVYVARTAADIKDIRAIANIASIWLRS